MRPPAVAETEHLAARSLALRSRARRYRAVRLRYAYDWQMQARAIAGRAGEVAWAEEIVRLMRVDKKRTMSDVIGSAPVVIQGGSKTRHLKHIAAESGVPLREMLFFDNERTNIQEVSSLGVTSIYCPRGLTREVYLEGVAEHLQKTAGGSQDDDAAAGRTKARKKERRMGGRGR